MNEKFYFRGKLYPVQRSVYFPLEDSYFLAESIPSANGFCIDIGCGSGIQSLNLLSKGADNVLAVDINPQALEITKYNCSLAGFSAKIHTRRSDLFENVPEKADVIVFNPPYVESENLEEIDLDGGRRGREVLERFLGQAPLHMNKGCVCYFLQTDLNGYAQTEKILKDSGLDFEIVGRKKLFFEELAVYSAHKK